MAPPSLLYLVRAPEDKAGFCKCNPGIMNAPYHTKRHQEEVLPIGGTGWMFTCLTCHRGFDIAVARHIHETLDDLSRRGTPRIRHVIDARTGREFDRVLMASPSDWLAAVEPLLTDLIEGGRYVFFDGAVLPYRHGPVRFQGLYRQHDLPDLPHLDPDLSRVPHSWEYWKGLPLEEVLAQFEAEDRESQRQREINKLPLWRRWLRRFQ